MLILRRALPAMALAAALLAVADEAQADSPLLSPAPGIFQQYYEGHGTIGSRMYTSPRPVPGWVGNTGYTYQPFYPHKFMWSHYDVYRRRHPGGGHTTTRAYYW
ncbi:MAG: hypothetical protein QM775_19235 [Pirellulales bacterium]